MGDVTVEAGQIIAFYLFDVGDEIVLTAVPALVAGASRAALTQKSPIPPYVQYHQPPLTIDGAAIGAGDVGGFVVRVKVFDYGVVSVALTLAVPTAWATLLADGFQWHDDPRLAGGAERACRALLDTIAPAMDKPHEPGVGEDYLVFAITHGAAPQRADALVASHGAAIAQLLRNEREPLSTQERDDVLRHRISYLANDLVIPTWNSALIYDTASGVHAALEILEFANSQLLEFRYYDGLLDAELARIYAQLQDQSWPQTWFSRRYARAARHVHALLIDVNELTDKAENALKIAGDVYSARLFGLTAARLGLDQWKGNVREKLKTLDDIQRFAVEQAGMTRGEMLELTIVAILVLELVLFFAGIMK